ncbi:MAG: DUF11 domain-containing protein, partial [Thermoplasmata archaeon]|nr:DUF11 domain-containing protein [Thermoplasmata archaeon]
DPSMVITKIANATTVVDGYILYTITYRNMGSGNATNVVITETYSPNVTFIGADISPDIGDDTWIIGLVPAGTMVTINILVQVGNDTQIGDIITNDVDLYYEDLSGNPFSDADGTTTTIIGPNMTLSKEAVANITYEDGITFDYYINYTNAGDWAYNVVIMDELPQGVVVTASSPQPSFINGTMHYWNFSSIGPGTSGSIRITVEVQSGAPLNITNNVTLSYTNLVGWASTDLFDQANTTITYLVFEDPAMEIIKTGTANAYAGQMLNYSLEYWNNGTGAAYNVIITETYPTGLIYWNSSVTPTSYNNVWNLGMIPSGGHGWINITMLINSTLEGTIINNVSLECENVLGEQMPIEYAEFSSLIELILETEAPPEIITTPPEFVFAGQNFTLYATANDLDTGVDTVILYYTDINGVNWDSIMIPLLIDGDGNGMYTLLIPAQTFKGIVSYFVWANDTDGNANRTGIYDVPVRLPPYYVWGNIDSSSGIAVSGAIVQITDLMTNETVMAVTDGTGYYEVDMATLYSGYLNGENLSVFATDGLYYGTNSSYIDLDFYEDTGLDYYDGTGMEWPNRQVDVVLSEIPEFTMLLTPIIGILLIVVLIRRSRRREENECEI